MATLVNGKNISKKIKETIKNYVEQSPHSLSFHIVYVGSDPVVDNFIKYKQEFGEAIGVHVVVHRYANDVLQTTLIEAIAEISHEADGMIVQLPLPGHLDRDTILNAVPPEKDVDVLSLSSQELFSDGTTKFFPPVTGAIVEVFNHHNIDLNNKKIVLIGNGTLVGYPTSLWLTREGYEHTIIDRSTDDVTRKELIQSADIIISGAGVPGMITPDLVKKGVVLIDAGTSESGKKIIGDIHPDCANVASVMTPVPGGIGPITIAVLYKNLMYAHMNRYA